MEPLLPRARQTDPARLERAAASVLAQEARLRRSSAWIALGFSLALSAAGCTTPPSPPPLAASPIPSATTPAVPSPHAQPAAEVYGAPRPVKKP